MRPRCQAGRGIVCGPRRASFAKADAKRGRGDEPSPCLTPSAVSAIDIEPIAGLRWGDARLLESIDAISDCSVERHKSLQISEKLVCSLIVLLLFDIDIEPGGTRVLAQARAALRFCRGTGGNVT